MNHALACPKCGTVPFVHQVGVPGFNVLAVCGYCGYQEEDGQELASGNPELQKPKPPEDKPTQVNVTANFSEEDIEKVVQRVIERLSQDCRLQPLA